MSVLDHLLLCKIRNADLHVPSPLCLPGLHRFAPSCVLMPKHECANEAACCFITPPSALLASSILFSCAEDPLALLWLSPSEHFHRHHPFISLSSITPHLKASISPKQPSIASLSEFSPPPASIIWDSSSGVTFWVDPPSSSSSSASLGLPLQLSPSPVFFTIALWSAPEKAGKLSLPPAKVSVGWAAGLPLSLWRMILWMKTEEMALGELLERLRTVIQTIGGWQRHIWCL